MTPAGESEAVTADYCKPGQVVDIPRLGMRVRLEDSVRYQYKVDASRCPVCEGLGMPWGGWFSCEDCEVVALIDTGEVFIPLMGKERQP